jgi:hypothetical protein
MMAIGQRRSRYLRYSLLAMGWSVAMMCLAAAFRDYQPVAIAFAGAGVAFIGVSLMIWMNFLEKK